MSKLNINSLQAINGRGAVTNPQNRFDHIDYIPYEEDLIESEMPPVNAATEYFRDHTKSLISYNSSPDIPFDAGINPYRGCEHGCVYCFARPNHEYLGLSAGLDFETKIFVKEDAAKILRKELSAKKWQPQPIAMSGVTDPYQPIERRLGITRSCLEVLAEFRNPVGIVTKNHLVTRDIDLLKELAQYNAAAVMISLTSLDPHLISVMEPRTSRPHLRLDAIRQLADAGIPVGVMTAPIVPGLNDYEIPAMIEAAAAAGAQYSAFVMLRLPYGLKDIFSNWLEEHFPDRKEKVLNRLRDIRGGKLNQNEFKERMRGNGIFAEHIKAMHQAACRKAGINGYRRKLSAANFCRPSERQLCLF